MPRLRATDTISHMPLALLILMALCAQNPENIERERKAYNEIYSPQPEQFSHEPNSFLVQVIQGRRCRRQVHWIVHACDSPRLQRLENHP